MQSYQCTAGVLSICLQMCGRIAQKFIGGLHNVKGGAASLVSCHFGPLKGRLLSRFLHPETLLERCSPSR